MTIMQKTACPLVLTMALLLTVALLVACSAPPESALPTPLEGTWRAVLTSPGGELPFELEIDRRDGKLQAFAVTDVEKVPFSDLDENGDEVVLHFAWYDSEITARRAGDGNRLEGVWRKTAPEGDSTLPFTATRVPETGDAPRFLPVAEAKINAVSDAPASIDGHWEVLFTDEDGSEPARGEFEQQGERVTGTFLTPTGDYRYLEGSYESGVLRLSTFDGAHAFLFAARARTDGTLEGDFWSRDTYHATWTARPVPEDEIVLPDDWEAVGLTNDEGRLDFAFPDLEGEAVSLDDPRFDGKVVVVNIFGTWCPNCNDEAPILARWNRTYRGQGLEIIGLAYEFTGETDRDRMMVRRFAERHGIDYTLLLAGTSDKQDAAATLPDLTAVLSYPTTLFLGRDGKVRKIHSGFAGPGTGDHHERLVVELEGVLEELLAESFPEQG